MSAQTIEVTTQTELDAWVGWLQFQGFGLRWYQPPLAMLVRPKRISAGWLIFWLLIGWILIWIPLFIYLILFAVSQDEIVTIRINWPPVATGMASACYQSVQAEPKAVVASVGDQPVST